MEWQVTSTMIWCPLVEFRVALMVKGDWTSYCTWHQDKEQGEHGRKMSDKCKGPDCHHVIAYRDKLVNEELGQ